MSSASPCARSPRVCPKKIPETQAIFDELAQVNSQADLSPDRLRISLDAKATVAIGPFSRRGRSRTHVQACDHDFAPAATITPVGILLPDSDELVLYGIHSRVTADCLVDCLSEWWQRARARFAQITTLVVNLDNGPENNSHRTQFLYRVVEFVRRFAVRVQLAYYPPYHSKFNAMERGWGVLERHWNGALLDTIEALEGWMASMRWRGRHPDVRMVTSEYPTGKALSKQEMAVVEAQVVRHPTLGRWFVTIDPLRLWDS